MGETLVFDPDDLTGEFKEIYEGIEAKKIETGSIELKFTMPLLPDLLSD